MWPACFLPLAGGFFLLGAPALVASCHVVLVGVLALVVA